MFPFFYGRCWTFCSFSKKIRSPLSVFAWFSASCRLLAPLSLSLARARFFSTPFPGAPSAFPHSSLVPSVCYVRKVFCFHFFCRCLWSFPQKDTRLKVKASDSSRNSCQWSFYNILPFYFYFPRDAAQQAARGYMRDLTGCRKTSKRCRTDFANPASVLRKGDDLLWNMRAVSALFSLSYKKYSQCCWTNRQPLCFPCWCFFFEWTCSQIFLIFPFADDIAF